MSKPAVIARINQRQSSLEAKTLHIDAGAKTRNQQIIENLELLELLKHSFGRDSLDRLNAAIYNEAIHAKHNPAPFVPAVIRRPEGERAVSRSDYGREELALKLARQRLEQKEQFRPLIILKSFVDPKPQNLLDLFEDDVEFSERMHRQPEQAYEGIYKAMNKAKKSYPRWIAVSAPTRSHLTNRVDAMVLECHRRLASNLVQRLKGLPRGASPRLPAEFGLIPFFDFLQTRVKPNTAPLMPHRPYGFPHLTYTRYEGDYMVKYCAPYGRVPAKVPQIRVLATLPADYARRSNREKHCYCPTQPTRMKFESSRDISDFSVIVFLGPRGTLWFAYDAREPLR